MSLETQRDSFADVTHAPQFASLTATEQSSIAQPTIAAHNSLWRDLFEIVVVIATIYTVVNLATARAIVEGNSMLPNFETGQLVIVNRWVYFFSAPERGDVIVLHNPRNPDEDFIKRVIGLPNETVSIRNGIVYVNGRQLLEPYIAQQNFCTSTCDGDWMLKSDEYFVLGDNRQQSHDSHSFGPVKRSTIVGQAWLRYWPLEQFGLIPHEDYDQLASAPARLTPPAQNTKVPPPSQPGRLRQAIGA